MAADFVKFFVLFVFVVADLTNAQLYNGDNCVLRRTGASGTCRSLKLCVSAINDLRRRRIQPQKCDDFIGTIPVVCCVPETSRVISRPVLPDTCPPFPPGAIKATKTGRKAWDYCIDLAEAVRPCAKRGMMNNAPLTRSFECGHTATPLIVGGTPATANEFPHMVLLGFPTDPIAWDCGGTLISKDWVMTAAHCTFSRFSGNVTHIRLGGGDSNSTLTQKFHFRVTEIITHPEYIVPAVYNDIALLKTDRSVTFAKNVRPACLHTGKPVHDERVIATGWGTTASRGKKSPSLMKVTLEKFSHQECFEKIPPVSRKSKDGVRNATQFCAGHHTEAKDTCQGDSGGPLQIYNDVAVECTYLVLGVTSNGKVCGIIGQPAIYTRVSAFIPWIEGIVWPN